MTSTALLKSVLPRKDITEDEVLSTSIAASGGNTADKDVDGWLDCVDECNDDPLKNKTDLCGCDVADNEADWDGTVDCKDPDECPGDPDKYVAGVTAEISQSITSFLSF